MSSEFVELGTKLGTAELIRSGVTNVNDMYFYPEDTAKVLHQAKIYGTIGITFLNFTTPYAKTLQEYIGKGEHAWDKHKTDLINFCYAPHAPYTVPYSDLVNTMRLTQEKNSKFHIHLHETLDECNNSIKEHGVRPIELMAKNNLLNKDTIAVHMTQLTDSEIDLIAEKNVSVVHCPQSNLKLASGFCPIAKLVDKGVNVALGTDSSASNNSLDFFAELKTASIMAKAVAQDSTAIPSYKALEIATINGAKALGVENITGSLDKGKSLDLIAIKLNLLESVPMYDICSHLVYCSDRHMVSDVMVAGEFVMRERELLTLNQVEIISRSLQFAKSCG